MDNVQQKIDKIKLEAPDKIKALTDKIKAKNAKIQELQSELNALIKGRIEQEGLLIAVTKIETEEIK